MRRAPFFALAMLAASVCASPAVGERSGSKIHHRLHDMTEGRSEERLPTDAAGRVQVLIEVDAMTEPLRARLDALGCWVERRRHHVVQAWVPRDALAAIAAIPGVRRIRPPDGLATNGAAPAASGAQHWDLAPLRHRFGASGRGVHVAVISLGVRGLDESVARGWLPRTWSFCRRADGTVERRDGGCAIGAVLVATSGGVTAWSFRSDGDLAPPGPGGAEGTAGLELVHRLAPDARLSFVNVATGLELLDAVAALARTADVIVCDIVVHTYFPDGRNLVARSVSEILRASGARVRAFIQPAGNLARAHYAALYQPSDAGDENGRFHLFRSGDPSERSATPAPWNVVTVPPATAVTVYLTWDGRDPHADYRLLLVNCATGAPADVRAAARAGEREPPDFVSFDNRSLTEARDVCYAIRRAGPAEGRAMLNVTILDPSGGARHRFNVAAHSILPPADAQAPLVVVGAAPVGAAAEIEPFSSRGPTFDGRPRPHVVTLDRLPVSGSGGYPRTFTGTSGAAAYLGGVSAVLLELAPALGAEEVQRLLMTTAVPLGPVNVYGAGRVDPVAAAEAVTARLSPR